MKAAIYARKSVATEKGESIDNQIQLCKEYGSRLGVKEFIIYKDEGFSGGNINRPSFKNMIKDAKNKKFNVLICYRLDRISRSVADFSSTLDELQSKNIDFISIKEHFDTSTPIGRAMVYISSVFAQLERETIAERIRDNMMELAKTGRWLGGTTPLGYKSEAVEYVDENGKNKKMYKLIEVPEEIEIVKLIYDLYIKKKGFPSVATYLCKNNYKGKTGGEFSRTSVEQIIKNPVYAIADERIEKFFQSHGAITYGDFNGINGIMPYNKRENGKKDKPISEWIVAIGNHKGIIPSKLWIKCQAINNENMEKSSPRSGTGNKFLLSGMMVCGICGSGMSSWSKKIKKTGEISRYYRCNLKARASSRCDSKMLNAEVAEDLVLSNITAIDINQLIAKIEKDNSEVAAHSEIDENILKLNKNIEDNKKSIQGLIRKLALLEDLSIINLIKDEINKLNEENKKLEEELLGIKSQKEPMETLNEYIKYINESLKSFKAFINLIKETSKKREVLKAIVESIVWDSKNEELIVNIIGSSPKLPNGVVRRRNGSKLCFGDGSR
ncbi:recombinase family protein [Clostridium sp. UBA4548]|uniref:recombinase family protein n=1 Tax=Clostridium sp. UBA4548 TaxID=1946361 RepID=UPI0025B95CB1|nr:recombinase family protein [Clostridium sp. UBA4548]